MALLSGKKILVTGDLCVNWTSGNNTGDRDADLDNWIKVLDTLAQWDAKTVVPGHGRICDEAEVVEYRDMLTIIRDRIADMAKKGLSLEQVKAARPSRDYDADYGATSGSWTTDMFVEAVYRTINAK